jgi:uncharacterized membrane protein YvbJ
MSYCSKCGMKNDDDATYCKKCGASLTEIKRDHDKEWDKRCEDECAGGKGGRGWAAFWGVIIVLVGLLIIFEVLVKNVLKTTPGFEWINTIEFGWIIAAVIGIFIIIFGLRILSKR